MANKASENIKIALRSIKGQLLRTILTMFMIIFGIMALVGIMTSVDAVKGKFADDFTNMGANTFTIRNYGINLKAGRRGRRQKSFPPITYKQAIAFDDRVDFPAVVSISADASMLAQARYKDEKTNPNVRVIGTDEEYLTVSGYELEQGRNFSPTDLKTGAHVTIIGSDLKDQLFKGGQNPVGQVISMGNAKYRVIGVLKSKGNSMGMNADNQALITLSNVRQYYFRPSLSFIISVQALSTEGMDATVSESIGLFRIIRKLGPGEDNSFEIMKSDTLAEFVLDQIGFLSLAGTIIAIITLLGSAIGLMNIMLVSVTERTREIGTRKAIGASASTIRRQFLAEAIVISQMGGMIGIFMGLLVGNLVSLAFTGDFTIPWNWIITGVVLCLVVGVVSGYYPAQKASRLDPIDALRYE